MSIEQPQDKKELLKEDISNVLAAINAQSMDLKEAIEVPGIDKAILRRAVERIISWTKEGEEYLKDL